MDCTTSNIGSNKTILALGGPLIKTDIDPLDNEETNYYNIDVNKSIETYSNYYEQFTIVNKTSKSK